MKSNIFKLSLVAVFMLLAGLSYAEVHIKSKNCERKSDGSGFFRYEFKNNVSATLFEYGLTSFPEDFCDLFNKYAVFEAAFPTSAILRVCFGFENDIGEIMTFAVDSNSKLIKTESQEAFNSFEECMASSSLTGN